MTASTAFKRFASVLVKSGSAIGHTISEHSPTKQATAELLRSSFSKAKEGLLNELTGKYKSRLVCELPAENSSRLIVEGSRYGKGEWQAYLETPVPGGGVIKRDLQGLFENVRNDNLIKRLDTWVDSYENDALDSSYIQNIRIPLSQSLQASPKIPTAG